MGRHQSVSPEKILLEAYDQLGDAVFRHCYFRVSDREKAKELTQETFMKTWEKLLAGEDIKNIRSYLYRIANNLIIDHYRKKKDLSLDKLQDEGFDVGQDNTAELENFIAGRELVEMLGTLSGPYRQVIVLRYIDDRSIVDIADILEVSPNVVSVRLNRALKKLRSLFNHE